MLHSVAELLHKSGRVLRDKMIELRYQIKEEIKMKFHEKLIKLRKSKGLSQEELAEMLDVSRQAISRWELESTLPDVPNLIKISEIFGVSTDYLVHDDYESDEDIPIAKEKEKEVIISENKRYKLHLIAGFASILAAFAFLIAALSELSIISVILSFFNCGIAAINFYLYFKNKKSKS